MAMAALELSHHPRLLQSASAQLDDLDPMVRLLGLDYLHRCNPQHGVPLVVRLLDDPDPRVAAIAEVTLMRWTGEDFGVRARLAIPSQATEQPGTVDTANAAVIRRGIELRRSWWDLHAKEYPTNPPAISSTLKNDAPRLPVADFNWKDLNGKTVHLTDLRGKVVLLNFWATWCPACLAEIPQLIALQDKLGSEVAILGVALDGVPDEHGDAPGTPAAGESAPKASSAEMIRAKVARVVQARGINYPILWDPKNAVGARFNGGELPTTVIIDAEGRMRRRFIGERSLPVFEAMLAEAAKPLMADGARPAARRD
jgi:thiol-disulfide isomerase/thioredoxin